MRRLFILRPEPGSSATLRRALELGLEARALPLFRIEPLDWAPPDFASFDALLLSSANAVRCAGNGIERLRGLPVYAVGDATAAAARETGLEIAGVGDGGIDALLSQVPQQLRLLHLCGVDRAVRSTGNSITELPVYRAEPLPLPGLGGELRGQVAAVHSPRAGARLAALVPAGDRQTIRVAAISPAAASAAGPGWETVEAAPVPSDAALLALAARLCEEGGEE
jgi:uroporphyrinogen-III synthase